jgi:hypothetical protein
MKDWTGLVALPVVAVGLLRAEAALVGAGLSFLLAWQALSLRAHARCGRGPRR